MWSTLQRDDRKRDDVHDEDEGGGGGDANFCLNITCSERVDLADP